MTKRQRGPERDELAAFLRSRRERLSPAQAGLPMTARRRTPGLRREEVAQLAGVGVTWYTWLEQGREIEVSSHFLDRIAQALRLDAGERTHLFMLAHNRPPAARLDNARLVTPALRRLLEAVAGPAYLATASLDIIAWNSVLSAVFGNMEEVPPADRNMLWLVFASPAHRAVLPNWEEDARAMLARFRVEFGRHRDDPDFLELIARLRLASHEFHRWWAEHDVTIRPEKVKRFETRGVGVIELEQSVFLVERSPSMRLVVYAPADAASARKIDILCRAWKTKGRASAAESGARQAAPATS